MKWLIWAVSFRNICVVKTIVPYPGRLVGWSYTNQAITSLIKCCQDTVNYGTHKQPAIWSARHVGIWPRSVVPFPVKYKCPRSIWRRDYTILYSTDDFDLTSDGAWCLAATISSCKTLLKKKSAEETIKVWDARWNTTKKRFLGIFVTLYRGFIVDKALLNS